MQKITSKFPIDLKKGIISVYTQIIGPRTWRSIKMAMDTGATYTMIPMELAADIGYDPGTSKKRIEISTARGTVFVPLIKISSISCWGMKVKNLEVVCHDLPPQSPVEGLLGLNFLLHFYVFLKFPEKILEITK